MIIGGLRMNRRVNILIALLLGFSFIISCGGGGGGGGGDRREDEPDGSLLTRFGYGTMMNSAVQARPLLVVLYDVEGSTIEYNRDAAYYDTLFFGPSYPNVADYYSAISDGKFTWTRADVMGPFELPDGSTGEGVQHAIRAAAENGFDFSLYDADGNGRVTNSELGIVNVSNPSCCLIGGQTSWAGCVRPEGSSVEVCLSGSMAGMNTGLMNAAHELSHQLGTIDVYGSSSLNYKYSLMAATIYGLDNRDVYHLDPWHKMRLGWATPGIERIGDPSLEGLSGGCASLPAAWTGGDNTSIILYDPYRGTNEYFMLEYRSSGTYDADIPSNGLGVWYIKTDSNNNLIRFNGGTFDPKIEGVSDDVADFLLFSPDGTRGSDDRRLWNNGDGIFNQLRWSDGSNSGLYIGVGPMTSSSVIDVEWAAGGPWIPIIYLDHPDISTRPDRHITISGMFGASQFGRVVSLTDGSTHYDLEVSRWGCSNISVYIPGEIPGGEYLLRVYTDSSREKYVGAVNVTITNTEPIVEITSPSDQERFGENYPIPLRGTSSLPGDRSLSDSQVEWYVDDVFVANGHTYTIPSGEYAVGSHTIRFYGANGEGSDEKTITIYIDAASPGEGGNLLPSANITSHNDEDEEWADSSDGGGWYKMVTFTGTGYDPEDGELAASSLRWTIRDSDNVVVATGTGTSFTVKLYSECFSKKYHVELAVTDSEGQSDTDVISFFVNLLC